MRAKRLPRTSVWTDKSVFTEDAEFTQGPLAGQPIDIDGDHDFLVGLSALSSTSNLSSTTHTSQPLDIVLVLDDSGSMAYNIDSDVPNQTVYTPLSADEVVESHGELRWTSEGGWFWETEGNRAYQLSEPEDTYYVSIDGRWIEVNEETSLVYGDGDYSYTSYREHVRWMAGNQEVDPETTTFYTRTVYNMSERRGALQYAVSNFIDQAAAMNAQITDENAKIRLSIVVFASDSSIENHLTVCEGANVDALKGTLNDLSANGATNAGAGMTSANYELRQNSNRDNTKQIVIFFTDGVPTTSDSFASGVANTAVDQAGAIKNRGGSVYSIGIFDGANPSETEVRYEGWGWPVESSQANVFMNAVSSNYPNSTAWDNLGQRATGNPDFYKSADNAGSLNEVFQDIFDESTEGATSGSPIEGTDVEGVQDAVPGTLTFTDTLGDYMEVTGNTMTLVYGGRQYSATKGEDGVYRFPEQTVDGNDIYKSAKLSDITISIQKGEGSAGDTVTVSMPASFIPLRNYTVTTVDGETEMSVTNAYPIRLFYGVSVKQDVLDNLGDPSNTTLQDYINENKTGGGSVNFYANKWSGERFGDTTATFTPNEGNKFYYYTDKTELYIDQNCNTRANRWNISDHETLYYKDTYWVQNGTSGNEETEVLSISVNGQDAQGLEYDRSNNAYIEAGTRRYDRPAGLASDKGENTTSTATDVLNPTWSNGTTVSQRLGNNGVIPVELPAQLSVTKNVEFGGDYGTVGFDETKYTNRSYEMTIHVDGASGTYKARVTNAQGDVVSTPTDGYFDITFSAEGNATQSLKDGEKLVIYGLDALADFEVTEEALGSGFTTEYFQQTGQLNADGTSNVVVTNTYTLSSTTGNGSELFKGTKVLDGRDWANGDTFTFQITGQDGAPTPTPNTVTVNAANTKVEGHDAATFNFSDVTYNTPGVYRYTIVETKPATAHPGMSYSSATYEVEVTVADKGDGTMTVTPKMTQAQADNVDDTAAGELEDVNAVFTNHFSETDTTAALGAYKDYSNNSGNANMDLTDGMFTIELRPTGDNADEAPMPANVQTDENGRLATTTNADNNFDFGRITYDNMMDGKTFTYQIREVSGSVINNMHYDDAVYTVQVTVSVNDQNQVSIDTAYFDADDEPLGVGEDGQAIEPTFVNKYDPTDATLTGEAAIHGDKTLTGRDMQQDETFGFTLAPQNQAAIAGVNNGTISIADGGWTTSISEGKNSVAKGFSFGDMTFTRAGVYTFTVTETSHNGETLPASDNVAGMTYDRDACTVTVTVTDENGVLTPSASYNNGADQPTDRAVFENTYTSSIDFGNTEGGIYVTKKLTGRNMTAGEFAFSVTAVETDGSVDAKTADAKLDETDRSFTNLTGAMAGVASQPWKQLAGMAFNQDDAGKTFVYEVRETTAGTDVLAVDAAVYTVSLTPHDNADGSMYVTGTVTKGDAEYASIDTSAEDYTAPTLAFENVYTPKPVSTSDDADTTLQVTKQVTGAPAVEAFDFELTLDIANSDNGADGVFEDADAKQAFDGMTVTTKDNLAKDEAETLSFDQLTFTKAGTYTFKVKETTTSDLSYWTYDNTEHTITVEVSDNNGQLEILYAQGNNPKIQNEYDHGTVIVGGDTSTPVEVKKAVTGWTTEADFNFTLAPADYNAEDPESVEHWSAVEADPAAAKTGITDGFTTMGDLGVDNAKTAKFGEITFTEPGTYTFNVTEDGAADFNKQSAEDRAGWTYDESTYTIVVEVSETNADDVYDGQLHAAITSNPVIFTNKYEAGTATVEGGEANFAGTKTIDGRNALADESFGFELSQGSVSGDGASWDDVTFQPADGDEATFTTASAIATMHEGEAGPVDFWFAGTFKFAHEGTYTFNVTEKQHNNTDLPEDGTNGMTYDRHVGTITVEVTDNGSGTLQTKVTPGTGDASVNFVNSFEGKPYTFGLEADEMLSGHKTVEDNVGSFQMADDQFTFVMRAQDKDNPMPDNLTVETDTNGYNVVSVKNTDTDAQAYTADYSFGSITFDHDDLAGVTDDDNDGKISKGFQYNVYENETDMPAGVSAVNPGRTYTITITVTEDLATGEITAKGEAVLVNPGDAENDPATLGSLDFVNKYDAGTITGGIQIYKTLSGRDWQQGDTFTFDVTMKADGVAKDDLPEFNFDGIAGTVADYTEADGELSYNITINPSQSATGNSYAFGTGVPTYTHEGTYVYTITERDSTEAGVTKDSSTYVVTVVIKDVEQDGEHVLNRTATITRDGEPYGNTGRVDFTNTYTATGTLDGAAAFEVRKTFTGRADNQWTDNDVFVFEMTGVDEEGNAAPMPEGSANGKKTITISSDNLSGNVGVNNFGNIAYGNDDRGKTYIYTIVELPQNADGQPVYGIDYSEAVYEVTVTVNDKATADGELDIQHQMKLLKTDTGTENNTEVEDAIFSNKYTVNPDDKTVTKGEGDAKTDVDGKLVGVGDTLDYTIHWVNDAVDESGVAQDATVTVTDNVPAGLTVDPLSISDDGQLSEDGRTITWSIEADAAAEGDVTYKATVDDTATEGGELTNTAQVTVGDNDPHQRVEATVDVPQKSMDEMDGKVDGDIQVGDVLKYTIEYANKGDQPVDITITDVVSAGLTVDEDSISNGGTLGENNTITWNLTDVAAGDEGAVTFEATVNEGALTTSVDNQATLKVGDDPEIKTNTVPVTVESGNLEISKTVEVSADQGTTVDTNKLFEFTVEFKTAGDNGTVLAGSYDIQNAFNANGEPISTVKSGDKIYLHHGNTATVTGLPEGAVYTVTETEGADDGYTQTAPVDADGRAIAATGTIVKGDTPAKAEFVNAYDAASAEGVPTGFTFTKVFEGREWTDAYSFQFKLTPEGDAPMPAADPNNNIVAADDDVSLIRTVTGPQDTGEATFDFGSITYSKVGTYKYTVSEAGGDNAGITYSTNVAKVQVDVKDYGNGNLVATATNPNNTFTNTYKTGEVVYDTAAGLDIVKNMTGHAIGAGDFTFTMTGNDEASIARLNNGQPLKFSTKGAELGEGAASNTATETIKALTNLTFTQQDVGKTYTYTVAEENGGDDINGVTYDGTTYEVKFVVTENGQGTLNVETVVNNESQGVVSGAIATNALPAQLVFNNSYDAGTVVVGGDTGVAFTGGKQLANRPLENGEFTFNVYDAKDVLVTSGTNDADGTITFNGITYDMAKLNADKASGAAMETAGEDGSTVYRYIYTITEDQTDFKQDGITAVVSSIDVTVEVTDDNQGHLTAKVVTPAEDIQFKNIYGNGEDGSFTSNLKGNKVVAVDSGDNAPGRDGFQFEVTVPEGAPEPERTTVTSDESGNVDFGEIVFTMENVFGDTGDKVEVEGEAVEGEDAGIETMSAQRTETFEYVVSEVNDGKPGVTYDTNSYTVTYTVTDLGNGKLDVQKTVATGAQQGNDFTFTNRYSVTPGDSSLTGNGGFVINKTLTANTGRTLADGEFSFALTDVVTGEVVKTATNAADGTVSFPAVTFTEPGTYNYTLSEVEGDAANVTYDTDQYNVTAKVTDMGDGTLKVEWTVEGVDPSEAIVFENTYEADPTSIAFKAAKVLDGRELTDGEFTFELRENGKVIDTATNDADGTVAFEKVEYTEPGAHDYEIAEVTGDDSTITYDDTVFTVHVNVVDNIQTGSLDASDWSYGENGSPVFHNTYTEPPAPVEPDEVIPATGDAAVAAVAATVAIGGTLVAAGYVTSKKRGE